MEKCKNNNKNISTKIYPTFCMFKTNNRLNNTNVVNILRIVY